MSRYINDRAALVALPDGRNGLVESVLPFRARGADGERAPVDLSLRRSRDGWVSRNPIVDVHVGERVQDAVRFDRTSVSFGLATSEAPTATMADDRVFWGNALIDTDVWVTPRATGAELFAQLRSDLSPERIPIRFSVPAGARLQLANGGMTAEVVRDEERLAVVAPPAAWDAEGTRVAVNYELSGEELTLAVEHRGKDLMYPVLVDPYTSDGLFYDNQLQHSVGTDQGRDGWYQISSSPAPPWHGCWGAGLTACYQGGFSHSPGKFIGYAYKAPRTAYIYRAEFTDVSYGSWGDSSGWDYLTEGIYNPANGTWEAYKWEDPADRTWAFTNRWTTTADQSADWKRHCVRGNCAPPGGSSGNEARATITTGWPGYRCCWSSKLFIRGADVYMDDPEQPYIAPPVHTDLPSGWTASATPKVTTELTDPGLGVKHVHLTTPALGGGTRTKTLTKDCLGVYGSRCPTSWEPRPEFTYATAEMPEGVNTLTLDGQDFIGHRAAPIARTWEIKVDRTPPRTDGTDIGGALWDQRGILLNGVNHALTLSPKDTYSGVASAHVYLDKSTIDTSTSWEFRMLPTCASGNECPTAPAAQTYSFNPSTTTDGKHNFKVITKDPLGHTAARDFDVLVDNNPPDAPQVTHVDLPAGWTDSAVPSVAVNSTDPAPGSSSDFGSGVKKLELLNGDTVIATRTYDCAGTIAARCTQSATHNFTYSAQANHATAPSLPEGHRTLRVKAYDAAGRSTFSEPWTLKVDRASPSLDLSGSLWDLPDSKVRATPYSLHAEATDSGAGLHSIDILVDGVSAIPADQLDQPCPQGGCPLSRDWSFNVGDYGPGEHTITIVARDEAGRERRASLTVERDTQGPALAVQHSAAPPVGWTRLYDDTLTVSASDLGTGVSAVEVLPEGGEPRRFAHNCASTDLDACPPELEHDFVLNDLPEGQTTVRVVAHDAAGNQSPPEEFTVRLDKTAPSLDAIDTSPLGGDLVLHGEARLQVAFVDAASGIGAVQARIDGDASAPGAGPVAFTCEDAECRNASGEVVLRSDELAGGTHNLQLTVTDEAGREVLAPDPSITFDVDKRPFADVQPYVTGRARQGLALTGHDGAWVPLPASFERQWERCEEDEVSCEEIAGATGQALTLGEADLGKLVRLRVTATNEFGSTVERSPARFVPASEAPDVSVETGSLDATGDWVGPAPFTATVAARDRGADSGSGIEAVSLELDGVARTSSVSCELVGIEPICPVRSPFPIDGALLSEGVHALSATATNTDGVASTVTRAVRLDSSVPSVALSGPLTAAGGDLAPGTHRLEISAADDATSLQPQSGVTQLDVLVDGVQIRRFEQTCELGACGFNAVFEYDTARHGAGTHVIEVVAKDRVGNESRGSVVVASSCQTDSPTRTEPQETVTTAQAVATLSEHHEEVIAQSEAVTVEDETYAPTLQDRGDALVASSSPAALEIPKDPAGSVVLGAGPVTACLTPEAAGEEATSALVVNGDTALYANTAPATDTVVRPVVGGLETWTSIRSASAPEVASWKLDAGDAELQADADGGARLVDPTPPVFVLSGSETKTITRADDLVEAQQQGEIVAHAELADPTAVQEAEEAPNAAGVVADASPEAVNTATPPGSVPAANSEPPESEPPSSFDDSTGTAEQQVDEAAQDQAEAHLAAAAAAGEAEAQALTAAAAAREQAELEPVVLAEVARPYAKDADGDPVNTALTVQGDTLNLAIDHRDADVAYPVAADPWITQPRIEMQVRYRPVYRSETRLVRHQWRWQYLAHGAGAHWIAALRGRPHEADWWVIEHGGKSYLTKNIRWAPIVVLVREPVYETRPVLDYWEAYEVPVTVDEETWLDDDEDPIPGVSPSTHVTYPVVNRGVDLFFNTPSDRCHPAICPDSEIIDELENLIERVPSKDQPGEACPGAEIYAAVHSIRYKKIFEAFTKAINECVRVRFLHNGKDTSLLEKYRDKKVEPAGDLLAAFNHSGGKSLYKHIRRTNGGGARGSSHPGAHMHSKFVLFSELEGGRHGGKPATWFGSTNMTSTMDTKFNSALVLYGHGELYNAMKSQIWRPLWDPANEPRGDGKVNASVPNIDIETSPVIGDGSDPVLARLKNITRSKCEIRVMHMALQRLRIAEHLRSLATPQYDGGPACHVKVITSEAEDDDEGGGTSKESGPNADPFVIRELYRIKAERRVLKMIHSMHDKTIIAKWKHPDKGVQHVVMTGSHNMTAPALSINDELLMTIREPAAADGHKIYDAFLSQFRKVLATKKRLNPLAET